jgi:superfamily II DNA or RNA helicase
MVTLSFHRGTLLLEGDLKTSSHFGFVWDDRVGKERAEALWYRDVLQHLHDSGVQYRDLAQSYVRMSDLVHETEKTPRDYQQEALDAWTQAKRRGLVVLPTGSGKSFVAEMCIAACKRSTLVVAPTIDLVNQWHGLLTKAFGQKVGMLGGGQHDIQPLTVSTYDSAYLHMDRYGDRFGLVIFDEVHHLPSGAFSQAAEMCTAPFRLGLSATPERTDDLHLDLTHLVGPEVYRRGIKELKGSVLADYTTHQIEVFLNDDETLRYAEARKTYSHFIGSRRIFMGGTNGWGRFLREAARSKAGRAALKAHQESRRIMHQAVAKMDALEEILARHPNSRVLIFTNDNATVYRISREFLVPVITHQTDAKERRATLAGFGDGRIRVIATSRVLNEGVDMPDADVGIVLSGTSTVREHVQRLGRILRPKPGKKATLYEVIASGTKEQDHSEKRREHEAYEEDEC